MRRFPVCASRTVKENMDWSWHKGHELRSTSNSKGDYLLCFLRIIVEVKVDILADEMKLT